MAELLLEQSILRFNTNENRIDIFVNGNDTQTYTTSSNVAVPTIAKFLKDKSAEINIFVANVYYQVIDAANTSVNASNIATNAANSANASAAAALSYKNSANTSATNAAASAAAAQSALANTIAVGVNASMFATAAQGAKADTAVQPAALGTISSQNANNVQISGGVITGIQALPIASGGTGANTVSGARSALGLGTAALANSNTFATAAQGALADTAVQNTQLQSVSQNFAIAFSIALG